jgi:hypothetical protein
MKNNSLKVNQNKDGSFTLEWDKQDSNWKWLNNLTTEEIQVIIDQAIQYDKNDRKIRL